MTRWGRAICGVAVVAVLGSSGTAIAGNRDRGQRHRDGRGRDDGRELRVDFDYRGGTGVCEPPVIEKVWVEPVYRTVCERVWVEPEYRIICDRIWHEPVVRVECEQVWVPDRYECREFVRWQCGRRVVVREQVLVERGHFETIERQIVVREGFWEDVQRRELVCEGRWMTVERRELVCAGHWETRAVERGRSWNAQVRFDRRD